MAIRRNSKKSFSSCCLIGTLLISALLLVSATQAEAKTVKFRIFSYLTKVELIAVPDVEGHVVLVYERRGVAIFDNGETAAGLQRRQQTAQE